MPRTEVAGTIAALKVVGLRVEAAAELFVNDATATVTRYAQINANTGSHPRGKPHVPGTGPGPNIVTGTLIRSIRPTPTRKIDGAFLGTAGPTVIYARALELGSPRWREGVKYPFFGPAVEAWRKESRTALLGAIGGTLRG